jgi:hypothetical protein
MRSNRNRHRLEEVIATPRQADSASEEIAEIEGRLKVFEFPSIAERWSTGRWTQMPRAEDRHRIRVSACPTLHLLLHPHAP